MLRCQPKKALATALWLLLPTFSALGDERVDYLRDIKPILERHCYACHGPDKQESGLRLDTTAALLKGGYNGAGFVAGKSAESLLVQAVRGDGDISQMPFEAEPLADDQVELLVRWVDEGAQAPADEKPADSVADAAKHWAFQPVERPSLPEVKRQQWVRNPIDAFVLARLEAEGIDPADEASRATLMRRVYLDLIGLPPTPAEQEEFLSDTHPDAYERLVDKLLMSPHYGERWGRHWLDQARYADSHGYTIDGPRTMWKYRDWVIDALNRDLPFDQFTIEQIAGDLLPKATQKQLVATGFHRNTLINQEGGTDDEQFRVEAVVDRVSTTGSVYLGLTVGCARCHDHKFDPISQRDFYSLFAFYNQCDEPQISLPTSEQKAKQKEINDQIATVQKTLTAHDKEYVAGLAEWEASLSDEERGQLSEEARAVLDIAAEDRDEKQREALLAAYRSRDPRRADLEGQIAALKKQLPDVATAMVMRRVKEPRETHVMVRGDFLRPGAEVVPDVPAVLPQLELPPADSGRSRLDLARWLVDPANPLTPRVTMNRIWMHYFGRGLVETEDDFGTQGTLPTHPDLLDWLTSEFVASGWSMKAMHRLIVTSSTYRQSSHARTELAKSDPYNKLLARQVRLRLEAEAIRDVALAASGLLAAKVGGPSVFPPQPDGIMRLAQVKRDWNTSKGDDRFRRGMYTYFWRSTPHPFLKLFDAPDANTSCTRRTRSNTPLQSLTLLNDETFVECAQALAVRILTEAPDSDAQRADFAFQVCFSREPTKYESLRIIELADTQRWLAQSTGAVEFKPMPAVAERMPESCDPNEWLAWTNVARALMNLDEFVTRE